MGGSSRTKEEKRTLPGVELGLKVKGALSTSDNTSTFYIDDNGRVMVSHQSPAPRGLRQIYTREAEFLIRQLAEDIERRIAEQAKTNKQNEVLRKELEELRARCAQLDDTLSSARAAHRQEVEELRAKVRKLGDAQNVGATDLDNTRHLMSLLEALFSDNHTLFGLQRDQQPGVYNISLSGIELVYEPQRPSLTAHSHPGVDHPIKPQSIELDDAQPTEAGLAFISTLVDIIFDPAHANLTKKWSDERLGRLFAPKDAALSRSESNDVSAYHTPHLPGFMRELGMLAVSAVVEKPTNQHQPEDTPHSAEPITPDPTANWTSSTP